MSYTLTAGAIGEMMQGKELTRAQPILQILGFKKIVGENGDDRYRLHLSDGYYTLTYAMLSSKLNNLILKNFLKNNTVIRVEEIISNCVNGKRAIVILDLTLIPKARSNTIIGSPTPWYPDAPLVTIAESLPLVDKIRPPPEPEPDSPEEYDFSDIVNINQIPIFDLGPINSKYVICGRVTNKTTVMPWTKVKDGIESSGKCFTIDLMDDSGEIRMTARDDAVDKFYDRIEVGKVYLIKSFELKFAKKHLTAIQHDLEMEFRFDTIVYPCLREMVDIAPIAFSFVDFENIEALPKDTVLDCIGILKRLGHLQIKGKKITGSNEDVKKRDIHLVDITNREIVVTLWGRHAEEFTHDSQPVVTIRRARVSTFQGTSLTTDRRSIFQVNPNIPEARILREWFDREGVHMASRSLSLGTTTTPWKLLREANAMDHVDPDKEEYFLSKATVVDVKRENLLFRACPVPDCNEELVDLVNGMYRCEKCNQEYSSFKWRIKLLAKFGDYSGHLWATCFHDEAQNILEMSAEELGRIQINCPVLYNGIVKECLFYNRIVKFRAKMESFNGEPRLEISVAEVYKLHLNEYAHKLVAEIKECAS